MKLKLTTAVCALAACLALAPAPSTAIAADASGVGISTGAPGAQTGRDFVQFMMMSDKFEIAAGRIALERARSPAVRDFARDMIAAHSESSADLKAASDRTLTGRMVTPPPNFDPQHQNMYNGLTSSFGRRFERIYIDQQIDAHQDALDHLEGYAANGRVPELQRFASHTAPIVADHLAMLRNINSDVAVNDRPAYRDYPDRYRNYPDR
jgi:putative membrane protein